MVFQGSQTQQADQSVLTDWCQGYQQWLQRTENEKIEATYHRKNLMPVELSGGHYVLTYPHDHSGAQER